MLVIAPDYFLTYSFVYVNISRWATEAARKPSGSERSKRMPQSKRFSLQHQHFSVEVTKKVHISLTDCILHYRDLELFSIFIPTEEIVSFFSRRNRIIVGLCRVTIFLALGLFGCSQNNPLTMSGDHDVLPALVTVNARLSVDTLITDSLHQKPDDFVAVLNKCSNPRLLLWWNMVTLVNHGDLGEKSTPMFTTVKTALPLRLQANLYDIPHDTSLLAVPDHPESKYGEARVCLISWKGASTRCRE